MNGDDDQLDQSPSDESTVINEGKASAPAASFSSGHARASLPETLGRFRIVKQIGSGSFGIVYLAVDPSLGNRHVALKVPREERFQSDSDRQAFIRDAEYAARLKHRGIVTVYNVEIDGDRVFIVQEYMSGGDLKQQLRPDGVPWAQAVAWMIPIAETVAFAHQRDIFHRDLKPANILLDEHGVPRIADFGLALHESEQPSHCNELAGTVPYMSPEQVRREPHRLDGRSDTWSLGVIFYELLTGRRPFRGTDDELFEQIKYHDPRRPRELRPDLPPELERICLRCLTRPVALRYASASDLAQELRNWQQTALGPGFAAGKTDIRAHARVVPKGLRAFDSHDAEFFLDLLPGPRDREGLPESIRFWKVRIEETDPARIFAVGLLHGPSGCGKSSLMKAGLLPRLASHVTSVFVESTALDTEVRILRGLRRSLPEIPLTLSLPEVLEGIRSGHWNPRRNKILIVLDQFEQWLHAANLSEPAQLVDALRYCDGEHLQCILLIREDFWTGISRFMQRLEIPIQEERNAALVDRFDPLHARSVLAEFGRAFGRLPDNLSDLTPQQQEFLNAAVEDLSEEGRVICVRLALFGDLIKGKPWTRTALMQAGGAEGLGVKFLEDTFAAESAPVAHRRHEMAVRRLFRCLLPQADSHIKGGMQSHATLLEASGYADRPQAFVELIRILNDQLRLITPTDPDGSLEQGTIEGPNAASNERFYQLTHDYLVPSVCRWLNLKQEETAKGRAEIRLAERSAIWSSRPENRHLPSLWEHLRIRCLTDRQDWTEPQRRMMRQTRHLHLLRTATAVVMLLVLGLAGESIRRSFRTNQDNAAAEQVVATILRADIGGVSHLISRIDPLRVRANPLLRSALAEESTDSPLKLKASLALLPVDSSQWEYLFDRLLDAEPDTFPVIRDALLSHQRELSEPLWEVWSDVEAKPDKRFRAACALAQVAPLDRRWDQATDDVATLLVQQYALVLGRWIEALRPVNNRLLPGLIRIYADTMRDTTERSLAADVLSDYAADQSSVLAYLVQTATVQQFKTIFPVLAAHSAAAIELLESRLGSPSLWTDAPLNAGWESVSKSDIAGIHSARGFINERFACCAAMPLSEFPQFVERLRICGFRPVQVRPWRQGSAAKVAAVWTRDGLDFTLECDATADEIKTRDVKLQADGFQPADVAGYLNGDTGNAVKYAVVWVRRASGDQSAQLSVGVSRSELEHDLSSGDAGNELTALHQLPGADGQLRFSFIRSHLKTNGSAGILLDRTAFLKQVTNGKLAIDLVTSPDSQLSEARHFSAREQQQQAELRLEADPQNLLARIVHADSLTALRDDADAVTAWTSLLNDIGPNPDCYSGRAISYARLGNRGSAAADVAACSQLISHADPSRVAYLEAVVALWLGDPDGLDRLRHELKNHTLDTDWLYRAGCAHAVGAQTLNGIHPEAAAGCAVDAVDFICRSMAIGLPENAAPQSNPDLQELFNTNVFRELMFHSLPQLMPPALRISDPACEHVSPIGVTLTDYVDMCQRMADDDYRPAAIAVCEMSASTNEDSPPIVLSDWQRPASIAANQDELARQRANAGAALLQLSAAEHVWPMLKHSDDPRTRSWLIQAMPLLGVDPRILLRQLELETDTTVRRAIILSLGAFRLETLPVADRAPLLETLQRWHAQQLDAGLHAAVEWLLRQWNQSGRLAHSLSDLQCNERELQSQLKLQRRNWYVNTQRQTFVIIEPGEFWMGSPDSESGRAAGNYETRHKRRLSHRFALAAHEVTQSEFAEFRRIHPATRPDVNKEMFEAPRMPQSGMTWFEAAWYCNWLSETEGIPSDQWCYEPNSQREYSAGMKARSDAADLQGYRLPTEAEWEYACRAGALNARYYGDSDELLANYAWYQKNSQNHTHPVGMLKPNDNGLFDMLGNNVEWCHDEWHIDGSGPEDISGSEEYQSVPFDVAPVDENRPRVQRGAGCTYSVLNVRCAARGGYVPGSSPPTFVGFRPARTMGNPQPAH